MGKLGREAVVVGAGAGGLFTARVLSDWFEHVTVLERDTAGDTSEPRPGVPQGKHLHALLSGGQRVLGALFPGFDDELDRVGASRIRVGLDLRVERPGFDPFPQADLGFHTSGITRPALERIVRRRVAALPNVAIEEGCRVTDVTVDPSSGRARGVRFSRDGRSAAREADLTIDASGTGDLTMAGITAAGTPAPEETTIGVDVGYASALFAIPDDAPTDFKGTLHFPDAPKTSRGALMIPVEGQRWILAVGGRGAEQPPGDEQGMRAFATTLRTRTVARAIANAKLVSNVERYLFRESRLRHFDRLQSFPAGLLPIADAICRFNPIFGQGISVAAQEAQALGELLASGQSLEGVWRPFFARTTAIIDTPWQLAAIPDFIYAETRGTRPPELEIALRFGQALTRAAAKHVHVYKLMAEVQHLVRPRTDLQSPEVLPLVLAELATA
jgi:2-polyprenyl-6-methoxyphenol hydroxylase-like FAD-dependent oxidoreductase